MHSISIDNAQKTILFIMISFLMISFSMILTKQESVLIRSDFYSRWYATNKLLTAHRSIYDLKNGQEIINTHNVSATVMEEGFYYPAHLLVFILPFALLPFPLAYFIWTILIQLFLMSGIWIICRETHWPQSVNQLTLLAILSLLFVPTFQNTIWGQFNTIGVLFLCAVYVALRKEKYWLAGILAVGLTFKPQTLFLPLIFLLFWSIFNKKRWSFLFGFCITSFVLWLFANWLEPGWVINFINGLEAYSTVVHLKPVLEIPFYQPWILIIAVLVLSAWIFMRNIYSSQHSLAFANCLVFSMGVWWCIVPIYGMMHMVALPIAIVLLLSSVEYVNMRIYKIEVMIIILLYFLGLMGFIGGLLFGSYGMHIELSELVYKVGFPILLVVFSVPLCLSKRNFENRLNISGITD